MLVPNWMFIGECEQWRTSVAVNQVVPILEPESRLVDQGWSKCGVQRQIGHLKVVHGEVSFRRVKCGAALVIQAVVGLRGNGEVGRMLAVDGVVETTVDAVLEERRRHC